MDQVICTSVRPASTEDCTSGNETGALPSAKSKTNKERVTEFLYQPVDVPTSDCLVFTENEGLVQFKVIITGNDFGPVH